MNADGSSGVRADITAGARVPFLGPLGWSLAGLAVIALSVAITAVIDLVRSP